MKENNNHNLKYLKARRKHLRNNGTSAEATLWVFLQRSQLKGRKFRRQHSVATYILDFYCPAEKLAIELDGDHHFTTAGRLQDQKRDDYLQTQGITVLRFENSEVFEALPAVLERITEESKACPSPHLHYFKPSHRFFIASSVCCKVAIASPD